jgi:hypothetical protein
LILHVNHERSRGGLRGLQLGVLRGTSTAKTAQGRHKAC